MNWYAIWLALAPLFIAIYFLYEDKDKKEVCHLSLNDLCPANHGESWVKCERLKQENIICPYLREKNKNIRKLNRRMD